MGWLDQLSKNWFQSWCLPVYLCSSVWFVPHGKSQEGYRGLCQKTGANEKKKAEAACASLREKTSSCGPGEEVPCPTGKDTNWRTREGQEAGPEDRQSVPAAASRHGSNLAKLLFFLSKTSGNLPQKPSAEFSRTPSRVLDFSLNRKLVKLFCLWPGLGDQMAEAMDRKKRSNQLQKVKGKLLVQSHAKLNCTRLCRTQPCSAMLGRCFCYSSKIFWASFLPFSFSSSHAFANWAQHCFTKARARGLFTAFSFSFAPALYYRPAFVWHLVVMQLENQKLKEEKLELTKELQSCKPYFRKTFLKKSIEKKYEIWFQKIVKN